MQQRIQPQSISLETVVSPFRSLPDNFDALITGLITPEEFKQQLTALLLLLPFQPQERPQTHD